MPDCTEDQAEYLWQNIVAILNSANMGIEDLVKKTTYLVREEDFAGAARA
jgi:enamine deaminase RidA (YjgF/YER057c/UK114 family)